MTPECAKFLKDTVNKFIDDFNHEFYIRVSEQIEGFKDTKSITEFVRAIHQIADCANDRYLPEPHYPALKRLLISRRRAIANKLEESRSRTCNIEVMAQLESSLEPYEDFIKQPWFESTSALPMPKLSEYLTLERAQIALGFSDSSERKYDEKFHILQAPEHFLQDLNYYRQQCDLRNRSVGIAFLDVDDFKKRFNTPHGEFAVDRYVLPRFMEALESHFFAHGYCYRFGGDEYAVVLPNAKVRFASDLMLDLQDSLTRLEFMQVSEKMTLSIGLCVADADCFLTNPELLERATKAKNFAKKNGKNCLAVYNGQLFRESDIQLFPNEEQ